MSNVLALDPSVDQWFIPKCDKDLPEDQQFKIKFHYLDARDEAKINDAMIKSISKGKTSKYEYHVTSADLVRCEQSITGWEVFNYPTDHPDVAKRGKPVPFSKDNIRLIPSNIRSEYCAFLTKRNEMPEEDEDEIKLGEAQ